MRSNYGTECDAAYVGRRTQEPATEGERPWEHHLWDVILTRNGQSITFPYRMGLGHEQSKCGKPRTTGRFAPARPYCHMRCESIGWRPTPPDLYSVLTSLKADATNGETFTDWCANYGYDTDSRKAMDTYLACQESEDRSRKFFGADWDLILEDEEYV